MPTYDYFCEHHQEFEIQHSIKITLEFCPHCEQEGKKNQPVKKLISKGSSFQLLGSGWAKDNYK